MAIDPVRQALAQRRPGKGVCAGTEHGDEDRGGRGLAALAVVDRHGVARPVHERFLTSAVLLPQHHVLIPVPPSVELAETADMCCSTCQPLCGGRIYVAQPFKSHD